MDALGDIVMASDEPGADFFLRAAQAAVRRYCGWHVCPVAQVKGAMSSPGGRIFRLPATNVLALKVRVAGADNMCAYAWDHTGLLEFARPAPEGVGAIEYEMTCGYAPEDVPDVQSVVLQAARRAAQAPAGSVKSQSVNGASVSYGFSGDGAPMVSLLASERAVLEPYRVRRTP